MRAILTMLLFLLSTPLFAEEGDVFRSATAGIEITKPAEWRFITAQENADNLGRMEFEDSSFAELAKRYASAPLVAMMKYPEPHDGLNPSIKLNIKPYGQIKGIDSKQLLGLVASSLASVFRDFEVAQVPTDVVMAGHPGAYLKINYTLVTADGAEYPTTSQLWIIPRGDFYFMIGAGISQGDEEGAGKEVNDILGSLVIAKQASN